MTYRDLQSIVFEGAVTGTQVDKFLLCIDEALEKAYLDLIFDFSRVIRAWPEGMIPIIAVADWLKRNNGSVQVILPQEADLNKLFHNTSWAHHLDSSKYSPASINVDHFNAKRFKNAGDQHRLVNEVTRLVVSKLNPPKDVLTGFEWSLNEITDNVLNHSDSEDGGIVQVASVGARLFFCIADTGRGILSSLKQGHAELHNDEQALGKAIKAGVTRDPSIGQGNGLAGALRVATMSGGAFSIASFRGRLNVREGNASHGLRSHRAKFPGTLVTMMIRADTGLAVETALGFSGRAVLSNILDVYDDDGKTLSLQLASETEGFGSRESGRYLRIKIGSILESNADRPLVVDWSGVPLISSSFADEAFGKLFVDMGPLQFGARIKHRNIESVNVGLVNKAIIQRSGQDIVKEMPQPRRPRNRRGGRGRSRGGRVNQQ